MTEPLNHGNHYVDDREPALQDDYAVHYRYYISFGNSHYAGAVMGFAAALSERRDDPDLTLSPTRLARKYHAEPATLRMTLRRLVEAGYLVKLGRNTYRLSHSARTLFAAERPQLFIPSMLRIDGMTPRLAAVHYVSVNAKIQSVAAKWFGVSERSWRSLRRKVDQLIKDNTSPIQLEPSVIQ